ncbi:MAG: response regulator [Chthoniobacterales bacterium]
MEAPLKILAVDNEPAITQAMRFVFSDPCYELTCVSSGHAALARLDANSDLYDVIIVDEKMPALSGLELVRIIRHRGINGKIIVVSAHLTAETRSRYEELGVRTMLGKPFNVGFLRAAVDR